MFFVSYFHGGGCSGCAGFGYGTVSFCGWIPTVSKYVTPPTGWKGYVKTNRTFTFLSAVADGRNPTKLTMEAECYSETSVFA